MWRDDDCGDDQDDRGRSPDGRGRCNRGRCSRGSREHDAAELRGEEEAPLGAERIHGADKEHVGVSAAAAAKSGGWDEQEHGGCLGLHEEVELKEVGLKANFTVVGN